MRNPKLNAEGYKDPTAYLGTQTIAREESKTDKRAEDLIKGFKYNLRAAGFELIERVQIRDVKSGREYR